MKDKPRVSIRRVQRDDEQEFVHLMRGSISLHEPWITPPTNPVLFKYYLQRVNREDHAGFVITRNEDNRLVGVININNIVRGSFQSASLGYYVGAQFQGEGYMQEGLQQLVAYAFNTMGLHRLEANIQPENTRSANLVARCGFVKEGYSEAFLFINGAWRDHERWCCIARRPGLRATAQYSTVMVPAGSQSLEKDT